MAQTCCYLIQKIIQQDPAFYAVLVSCRPDQNWMLIHRMGFSPHSRRRGTPHVNELSVGPSHSIKYCSQHCQDHSDIQSTVLLPNAQTDHILTVVPGSHTIIDKPLNRELVQNLRDTSGPCQYDSGFCESFGISQRFQMQPGDLLLTMPHLLRRPESFDAVGLLNLSQQGLDAKVLPRKRHQSKLGVIHSFPSFGMQYLRRRDWANQDMIELDIQLGCASALSDAFLGSRAWSDRRVIHQRNLVLGADLSAGVAFIEQTRNRLVAELYETLDVTETSCHCESTSFSSAVVDFQGHINGALQEGDSGAFASLHYADDCFNTFMFSDVGLLGMTQNSDLFAQA